MKKKDIVNIAIALLITTFMVTTAAAAPLKSTNFSSKAVVGFNDYDPLVDIEVTVEIKQIRSFDKIDQQALSIERIDWFSDPDLYVKIFINDEVFTSDIWRNTKYVYEPNFAPSFNVPDDEEIVNIKIQLWDWNIGLNRLCDISTAYFDNGYRDSFDVELEYSIKTGHWTGDDSSGVTNWDIDVSGYGRLNGCDDGSIYQRDRDCELWFDIYQTDPDGDGIPYWSEVNYHGTDPEVNNTGEDLDEDGCPIEWEDEWGHLMWYDGGTGEYRHFWVYDDLSWNDHENLDPDNDGLNNVEEYMMSEWDSDPFRADVYVEMDIMEEGPNGEKTVFPEGGMELIRTAFNRQNIVFHLDDGRMGGFDSIPFDENTSYGELFQMFNEYFLHGNDSNWRRGVFHYGLFIYNADGAPGYLFNANAYQISAKGLEEFVVPYTKKKLNLVYGSAYMHECGHTFGFHPIGGHDQGSKFPWQLGFWKWRPYKSCMNYGYMYKMVDYSDGSRDRNDFDDWKRIDLKWFENQWF